MNMKELIWIGSSLDNLKEFPEKVMDMVGFITRGSRRI